LEDAVGEILGKQTGIAKAEEIELQGLGFDAPGTRDVADLDTVEIRLTGDRTKARDLASEETDLIGTFRMRIREGVEEFGIELVSVIGAGLKVLQIVHPGNSLILP
jgi:hypothetical protein